MKNKILRGPIRALESKLSSGLAVIIPAYNMRSRYSSDSEFSRILLHYDSLARQYQGKVDFHVVDDCSTDGSDNLFRDFEKNSAVKFHYMPRNAKKIGAIKKVINGLEDNVKFILHTDFDCKFKEGSLDNAIEHTNELALNPQLGGFGLRVVPERSDNILEIFQELEYGMGRFSYVFLKYEGKVRCVGGAGGLWKREVYEKALENHSGMFISEDMEQTARVMHAGNKVGYAKDVVLTTRTPRTFKDLLKQRVRWAKGALYSYHNVDEFYKGQALKFLPRKSVHGLMTAVQMTFMATTPGWAVYTAKKLAEGDVSAGLQVYGLGLAINTGLAVMAHKEFDHKLKCFALLPVSPIIEYGVYFPAHIAAYYQFVKERAKVYGTKLSNAFAKATSKIKNRFALTKQPAVSMLPKLEVK